LTSFLQVKVCLKCTHSGQERSQYQCNTGKHNTVFGNGHGKLKEQTFRIAHMGDITLDDLKELLAWIDEEIA
jgi:aspartate aminotransferase-like enzyme